jgi:hypothetical protein
LDSVTTAEVRLLSVGIPTPLPEEEAGEETAGEADEADEADEALEAADEEEDTAAEDVRDDVEVFEAAESVPESAFPVPQPARARAEMRRMQEISFILRFIWIPPW